MTPSRAIKLFGTEQKVAPPVLLSAGPLTAELDDGGLRYIRLGGKEVLRGVAFLVRDKNWGTYNPAIENLKIDSKGGGFTVSYDAECRDDAQAFRFSARIEGKADGSLAFSATGEALSDFLTNRTGFVVLHPVAGVAGRSRPEVGRFLDFLAGAPAAEAFRRHGFRVLADAGADGTGS